MQLRGFVGPSFLLLSLSSIAGAQDLARNDPNQLRDPTMLSLSPREALRGSVQLLIGAFLQALRDGDAVALRRADAGQLLAGQGCALDLSSDGSAARRINATAAQGHRPRPPKTLTLAWGDIDVVAGTGDTVAVATTPVSQRGNSGVTTAPVTFVIVNENGAPRIKRVTGPLAAACGGNSL